MDSPQILSIQILIISWPWASLESRSQNIVTTKRYWSDKFICSFQKRRGKFAGVFYQRGFLSKEEIEYFSFLLKSVTYLFQWFKGSFFVIQNHLQSWQIGVFAGHWINQILISRSSIFVYYFQLSNSVFSEIFNFVKYSGVFVFFRLFYAFHFSLKWSALCIFFVFL